MQCSDSSGMGDDGWESMMFKKGFTVIEIMIVVAIIAILALIAVASYQRYIEHARSAATQSLLQQLAMAEAATLVETEAVGTLNLDFVFFSTIADVSQVKKLSDLGFRPDPQVGFAVLPPKSGVAGFVAFAAHRGVNSSMHVYDDVSFNGVRVVKPGLTFGADPPDELPIFIMTENSTNPIISTETVKVDIATGLVTSSGP